MSTNFPTTLDALTNPTSASALNSPDHAGQHADANDAIEALEAKVGANSSAVTTSHDYKLGEVTATDKAVGKTATQILTNKTLTSPVLNVTSDATGDMYYRNSGGLFTRLPIGSSGQIINADASGIPAWVANPAAADASTTVKGVLEVATTAEITAGTSTGATGATLAVPASAVGSVGASKIVQFNSSTQYPAADGSLITNISSPNYSVNADELQTGWHTMHMVPGGTGWTLVSTPTQEANGVMVNLNSASTQGASITNGLIGWNTVTQVGGSQSGFQFLQFDNPAGKEIRLKILAATYSSSSTNKSAFGFSDVATNLYSETTTADASIKFVWNNTATYAVTSTGAANTNTSLSGVTLGKANPHLYEIHWTPGTSVKFYVDGVLKATHTTNIPTGTGTVKIHLGSTVPASGNSESVWTNMSMSMEL